MAGEPDIFAEAAFGVNCMAAHKFYSAISAACQAGVDPCDVAAITRTTLYAQVLIGPCLLFIGALLAAVGCLLAGRRATEP
jgi:hypothetical protein